MARVKVIGLGNVLMRDDGVGPHVVRVFDAAWEVPADAEVEDLGTPGLDLVPHVAGVDALIVVDAARLDAPPGSVHRWTHADWGSRAARPRVGPHDPGLEDVLRALAFAGDAPRDVVLLGVVPDRVETGAGITPVVRAAVPRVVDALRAELARLGAAARPRVPPRAPDLWWEAEASGPVPSALPVAVSFGL